MKYKLKHFLLLQNMTLATFVSVRSHILSFTTIVLKVKQPSIKRKKNSYGEPMLVSTELFRTPLVSFIFERGWRQRFLVWGGFPDLEKEVAKISRVLRLGGVFVATTYILDGPFGFVPFLRPLCQQTRQISDSFIFLSEWELEDLCKAYGLVGFTCIRNGAFVMISATKPT
ncbi:hypothetical protein UlMin_042533 [Ulmus minor]